MFRAAPGAIPRPDVLEAAERYIAAELRVFLLAPGSKKPPKDSSGFREATGNLDELRRRLERHPGAGLAVATGKASGCWVLDLDVSEGKNGLATLEALEDQYGELPETWVSETPRGGRHYWFAWPDDGTAINCRVGVFEGVDTRGDGGYVVVAPTVLVPTAEYPGGEYRWVIGQEPGEIPLAPAPPWLVEAVTRGSKGTGTGAAPAEEDGVIPDGKRNGALASIAGRLRRDGLSAEEIEAALQEINRKRCKPPLSRDEVRGIARSIGRYSPARPLVAVGDRGEDLFLLDEPLTDVINGQRLGRYLRGRAIYSPGIGWLAWDGRRWAADPDKSNVLALAKEFSREFLAAATRLPDEAQRERVVKGALTTQRLQRLQAALEFARTEEGVLLPANRLDADPWLLAVENGYLDLRTGELRPHDPDALVTRITEVAYDPEARSELFDRFLRTSFPDDEELLGFLQLGTGTSLVGEPPERALFLLLGPPASGKSSFLSLQRTICGEHGSEVAPETLLDVGGKGGSAQGGQPRADLVALRGVRAVFCSELPHGSRFAAAFVKRVTGADKVRARAPYAQGAVEFKPVFSLWIAGNDAPHARVEDAALWERIRRIDFPRSIPEEERDPRIRREFEDPGSEAARAALAWAVQGAVRWHESGLVLPTPRLVQEATRDYREREDPLRPFLEDRCLLGDKGLWTPSATLRAAYESWCAEAGIDPVRSSQTFAALLRKHGCEEQRRKVDGKQTRGWRGIHLLDPVGGDR